MDDENVINNSQVKPNLKSNEKKRFHQIAENFLKGSHHFMTEFHSQVIKSVDTKILNNDFTKQYQEHVNQYTKSIQDRANQVREENDGKSKLWNTILNFIIACQLGIIAFGLMPNKMKKVVDFAKNIGDVVGDELKKIFSNIDLGKIWDQVVDFTKEYLGPIGDFMVELVFDFFNEMQNNVFLRCLDEWAKSVVSRAKGPLGWMLKLAYAFFGNKGISRPVISHWLMYGNETYKKVEALDNANYDVLRRVENTATRFSDFSNAAIGVVQDDEGFQVFKGVDAGNSRLPWTSYELDEVKEKINEYQHGIQKAAEEASQEERVESFYGNPNLLDTEAYRNLIDDWQDWRDKTIDIEWGDNVDFENLTINLDNNLQDPKNTQQLKDSYNKIIDFQKKYSSSSHPFAKQICDEIKNRFGGKTWGSTNIIPIVLYMFIPAIYYAICQFEFILDRNDKLSARLNRDMKEVNQKLDTILTEKKFDEIENAANDVRQNKISFSEYVQTFIKYVDDFSKNPILSFERINFGVVFSFKFIFIDTLEIVNDWFERLKLISQDDKKFRASSNVYVSDRDVKEFEGEIQVGNESALIESLVKGQVRAKNDLKRRYERRNTLLKQIKEGFDEL